jgi:hypothetical protein
LDGILILAIFIPKSSKAKNIGKSKKTRLATQGSEN